MGRSDRGRPVKYPVETLPAPVVFYGGPVISREEAMERGEVRFFTGEPCIHNHIAERWVKSRRCIQCVLESHRTPEYRDYANPVWQRWLAEHPEKPGEYNAQRRAKADAIPPKSQARRDGLKRHWVERKAKAG